MFIVLNLTKYISFIFISLAVIFSPELDILSNIDTHFVESTCCSTSNLEQSSDKKDDKTCNDCKDDCEGNCNDLGCHFSSTSFVSIDFLNSEIDFFSLEVYYRTTSLYKKDIHINEFMHAIWHPPKA